MAMAMTQNPRLDVLGTFGDGEEALAFGKDHEVDLLLIDYNLGMSNGIDIGQRFLTSFPQLKVILFSMFALEVQDDFKTSGFHGLIDKAKDIDDFTEAIDAVLDGKAYLINRVCARKDVMQFDDHHTNLSNREKEVLSLLAQGKKQYEIAKELHLSTRTIEGHRERICKKLGLTSIAQLALYAARSGIFRFGSNSEAGL
jgi:DNA-binding NarL/FixJ family response regulator